ncbi:glucose-methanol-choline oxidoreductase [Flammeovirgaceae bacterium 311]|nr:glucose-methanol-choline oxidoreductase [Flammeovirgaceae bacterium 311]
MNLNIKSTKQNTYDAIVVGSGISGGWAAKELTEKGLKVLLLDRGWNLEHGKGYETAMKDPWEFKYRGKLTQKQKEEHPYMIRTHIFYDHNAHYWLKDIDSPYEEEKRFDWFRPNIVGGKSIMWGRQSYRFSEMDFEANLKDGIAVDWPIRYKDLAPWYDYVERFAGISGEKLGLSHLPDSKFLPPMELNCLEKEVKKGIESNFRGRFLTIGRVANLTVPHNGRASCQYRNLCMRGCPFGAYFSTQSATLPAAMATGNLTLRPNALVSSVIYDEEKGKATGVQIIDSQTNEMINYYASIIFLNASTLGTTSILLNSTSDRFPNGLGNSSEQIGKNLMDHHFRIGAEGEYDGFQDQYYYGRRANGIYIPRYRNLGGEKRNYVRGFGYQGGASRENWQKGIAELGFGADFKESLINPGKWKMGLVGFGECLPYEENKVTLNKDKLDKWGQPTLKFDCEFKENENLMRQDMMNDAAEMLEAAGIKHVKTYDRGSYPGMAIHEMGTARMGRDPKTSVLNAFNQMHDVPNVFITDGSAMTSSGCQNPSLTYMALTARACDYAVSEMKKRNL